MFCFVFAAILLRHAELHPRKAVMQPAPEREDSGEEKEEARGRGADKRIKVQPQQRLESAAPQAVRRVT